MNQPWFRIIIGGFVCIALFIVVGCGGSDEPANSSNENPPNNSTGAPGNPTANGNAAPVVSAADLAKAYVEDSAAAGEKYGFKIITLEGEVLEVKKVEEPIPTFNVMLKGIDRDGGDPVMVQCTLNNPNATVNATAGQTAKIKGKCSTMVIDRVMVIESEVLEISGAASAAPVPSNSNSLDVAYIAPEFFGALVIHPARLVQSPLVASLRQKEVLGEMLNPPGLEPSDIEHLIVLIDTPPGGDFETHEPTLIARFHQPQNKENLLRLIVSDPRPAQHDSHTYYRGQQATVAFLPDDKTLIAASEQTLLRMLAAGEHPQGPLVSKLKQLDLDNDLVGAFVVEPVRKLAGGLAESVGDSMPPQFAAFATLPEKVGAASLQFDLSDEVLVQLAIAGNDAAATKEIAELVTGGLAFGKLMWPEIRGELGIESDPDEPNPLLDTLNGLVNGLEIERSDQSVVLNVRKPQGLEQVTDELVQLALQGAAMESSMAGGGPDDWEEYEIEDLNFAIAFPQPPEEDPIILPTDDEPEYVQQTQVSAWSNDTDASYEVMFTKCQPATLKEGVATLFEYLIQILDSEVDSKKDIDWKGHPGIEFRSSFEDGEEVTAGIHRFYLIGDTIYTLAVRYPPDQADDVVVDLFLDSFRVLVPPPSPPEPGRTKVVKRTWKNNTGQFSVEAELVELTDDQVTLKKDDGKTISVPINILSDEDQVFLKTYREMKDAAPVAIDETFASTLAEQSVKWLNQSNALGVDHQLVKDVTAKVEKQVGLDRPFVAKLGPGLLKSNKMTMLAGQGDNLFALVPSADSVAGFPETSMVFIESAALNQTGHSKPVAKLSSLKVNDRQQLDGSKNITGSVQYEHVNSQSGHYALRLVCMAGNNTVTLYDFLDEGLPGEKAELTFSFAPIVSAGVDHKGPLVAFVELVSFPDASGQGNVIVTSNAVADVVNIVLPGFWKTFSWSTTR